MKPWIIWIIGGRRFIVDSLAKTFSGHDFEVVDERPTSGEDFKRTVAVVTSDHPQFWELLEELANDAAAGVVAVLDQYDLDRYSRAFCLRAGVVHLDSSAETITDVICARARGEILAPVDCIGRLAGAERSSHFSPLEQALLEGLARGESVGAMGERIGYSDRTVRRRLQSLYFRLGVIDRAAAVAQARQLLQ